MKMKIVTVFLLLFCLSINAFAQNNKAFKYIETYKDLAIKDMQQTGVPAAITLAQGMLESGYGESDLCQKSNNHFGIKCKLDWTGDKVYHDDDEKGECFRKYASAAESYQDHSTFLKTRPHYSFLFQLPPTDFEAWAKGLKKAGYATEKDYPQRLIKVINDYGLNQYTLQALVSDTAASMAAKSNKQAQDTEILGELLIPISSKKLQAAAAARAAEEKEEQESKITMVSNTDSYPIGSDSAAVKRYPSGIFQINHAKVVYASKGTSLLGLANKHNVTFSMLLDFNDMDDLEVLPEAKLVFIEKKLKKGAVDAHIVGRNETLHDVCQAEGVRLESILEYNHLKKDAALQIGQKILLKPSPTPNTKTTNTLAH